MSLNLVDPTEQDLLKVENLSVAFKIGGQFIEAVHGITFSVKAGEWVGLVGESGCGKSVTSLAVMGLLNPDYVRVSVT